MLVAHSVRCRPATQGPKRYGIPCSLNITLFKKRHVFTHLVVSSSFAVLIKSLSSTWCALFKVSLLLPTVLILKKMRFSLSIFRASAETCLYQETFRSAFLRIVMFWICKMYIFKIAILHLRNDSRTFLSTEQCRIWQSGVPSGCRLKFRW